MHGAEIQIQLCRSMFSADAIPSAPLSPHAAVNALRSDLASHTVSPALAIDPSVSKT